MEYSFFNDEREIYIKELMSLFDKSFINAENELILMPSSNLYFGLYNVKNIDDFKYKIVAFCSRPASKEKNNKYVRKRINQFLGVNFTKDEWLEIYSEVGAGCNEEKCMKFIQNNYNFNILKEQNDE